MNYHDFLTPELAQFLKASQLIWIDADGLYEELGGDYVDNSPQDPILYDRCWRQAALGATVRSFLVEPIHDQSQEFFWQVRSACQVILVETMSLGISQRIVMSEQGLATASLLNSKFALCSDFEELSIVAQEAERQLAILRAILPDIGLVERAVLKVVFRI